MTLANWCLGQEYATFCINPYSFHGLYSDLQNESISHLIQMKRLGKSAWYKDSTFSKEFSSKEFDTLFTFNSKEVIQDPSDPDNPFKTLTIDTLKQILVEDIRHINVKRLNTQGFSLGFEFICPDGRIKSLGYVVLDKSKLEKKCGSFYSTIEILMYKRSFLRINLLKTEDIFNIFTSSLSKVIDIQCEFSSDEVSKDIYLGLLHPVKFDSICFLNDINYILKNNNPINIVLKYSLNTTSYREMQFLSEFVGFEFMKLEYPSVIETGSYFILTRPFVKQENQLLDDCLSGLLRIAIVNNYNISCWKD